MLAALLTSACQSTDVVGVAGHSGFTLNIMKKKMNKLIAHIKKVAIKDIRLFFEPLTAVKRLIRRMATAITSRIRRSKPKDKKDDGQ